MEKIKVQNAKEVMDRNKEAPKKVDYNKKIIDILALSRLKILSEKGEEIRLGSFWEKGSVIIVFIRHFSCIACRAHVDKIWNQRSKLKNNKTRIIFIGNGTPHFIQSFKKDMNVQDAEIYTDPSLQTYDACRMNRGFLNLLDPRGAINMIKLKKEGYSQGPLDKESGVHRQMGGVVAIKPPGKIVYHFVASYLGDFDNEELWPDKN